MTITTAKQFDYSKVPAVTGVFWLAKLITTGMGESVSDALSSIISKPATLLVSLIAFAILLVTQMRTDRYRPQLYWPTVATLAIAGTALADETHDGLGIGYPVSVAIYLIAMIVTMVAWYRTEHGISIHSIFTPRREAFYWLTVVFSFTLGTAAGDWFADGLGLGFLGTAIALGVPMLASMGMNGFSKKWEVATFWFAYILTRPVGASIADYCGYGTPNLGNEMMSLIWIALFIPVLAYLIIKDRHQTTLSEE
ncbi:hypothetical protein [Lactiplantibacillus fabifermentans]|nr:hypothetical protein [Lactiplantibacillus fabifermentans]ETY75007.1 hypothetical protein LFAB_04215 [Lactiplantibacillus fabifermentans T30PCM01]